MIDMRRSRQPNDPWEFPNEYEIWVIIDILYWYGWRKALREWGYEIQDNLLHLWITLRLYYLIIRYRGLGYLCEWNIRDSGPFMGKDKNKIRLGPNDNCYKYWMNASALPPWGFYSDSKYYPWGLEESIK